MRVSPSTAVSSRTNYSHDDRMIKNISSLTVRFDTTYEEGVGKFNSVVDTTSIDLNKVRYIHCTYTNKHHLLALLEKKKTPMTKKNEGRFPCHGFQIIIEEVD